MKSKLITKITPYLFEEYLIIPLHKKWIDVFQKIPEFEVKIDSNNRLVLQGPQIKRDFISTKNSLSEHKILGVL